MASKSFVVNVDSLDVASSVIKSLRSSASSQKRYQLQARSDEVTVEGVGHLNTVIEKQRQIIREGNSRQQAIDEAISNHTVPPGLSPLPSPQRAQPAQSYRLADDDSDDEREQHQITKPAACMPKAMDEDADLLEDDEDMRDLLRGFTGPSQQQQAVTMNMTVNPRRLHPLKASGLSDTAALLKGIKPGQAIRVKASGKNKKTVT